MNYIKNLKWEMIIFSIGCIAIGILFTFFPSNAKDILGTVLAIVMFFYSIRHFIEYFRRKDMNGFTGYELVLGVIFLVLGFICLYKMGTIIKILGFFVGAIILISGLMKVENAFDLKRMGKKWIPMLVIAIILIILSIVFFIHPNESGKNQGDTMLAFAGIAFMFVGFVNLISTLAISSAINEWTKEQSKVGPKVIDVEYEDVDKKEE